MKRSFNIGILLILLTVPLVAHAFGSATHLYIAEHVSNESYKKIDLFYGGIAPDLAMFVANPEKWPTAYIDTHYSFRDLRPYAWSFTQKAFALGWMTHNEYNGADHYAHIEYPIGEGNGYVVDKAQILSLETGLDPLFAPYAIETAIDLLLKYNDDRDIGIKLLKADISRSPEDLGLLLRVLVFKEKRTDWLTLATAELTFRKAVSRYAMALSFPEPYDKKAMSELGSRLAKEVYGIIVSPEEVLEILNRAIDLCEGDYKKAIDFTIEQIKNQI